MSKEMKKAYTWLRMKDFFSAIKIRLVEKFCDFRIRRMGFSEVELERLSCHL